MQRVVVGLSGGVDSSVAAHLLVQQGYEVIALFMRNWHDESVTIHDECPWIEDSNDAMLVAEKLGIPFQVVDLSAEYQERIVDYMFAEYRDGRTPNPDVLCNREIKFDIFLQKALQLGADYVATGHYCQKAKVEASSGSSYRLLAGNDPGKDQSYFLCQLTQEQLAKALFPIGHLQKAEVREIARQEGLITAEKKDSQGLCFVGKVRLPDFLQQKLAPRRGKVVEIDAQNGLGRQEKPAVHNPSLWPKVAPYSMNSQSGKIVGEHSGAHYFTVGQRKGLAIGGTPEPLFVLATDTDENVIYAGQGDQHPLLRKEGLYIESDQVHWLRTDWALQPGEQERYAVRIRYRQPLEPATLYREDHGLYIIFDRPQKAITPGQFAAWYHGNELVGSGVIAF